MTMILELGIISGLILGLCEASKKLGVPKNLIPVLAVFLGIGAMYLQQYSPSHAELILYGTMAGLSAVGLYETGKNGVKVVQSK